MARNSLEVDLSPTFDKVMELQTILKSELQLMAKIEPGKPSEEDPKIKALKTEEELKKTKGFKGNGKGNGKGGKSDGKGKSL